MVIIIIIIIINLIIFRFFLWCLFIVFELEV